MFADKVPISSRKQLKVELIKARNHPFCSDICLLKEVGLQHLLIANNRHYLYLIELIFKESHHLVRNEVAVLLG